MAASSTTDDETENLMRYHKIERAIENLWALHGYSFKDERCACGVGMNFSDHEMHVAVGVFKLGKRAGKGELR